MSPEIEQVRKGGLPPLFVTEYWSWGGAGVNRPSLLVRFWHLFDSGILDLSGVEPRNPN